MITILGVLAAAVIMVIVPATPAKAGVFGTIVNNSHVSFTAARFNKGSTSSCTSWNPEGTDGWSPYTWTDCQGTRVYAYTTTGFWFDVDAFRPDLSIYPYSYYYVKFTDSGQWHPIDVAYFTLISRSQTAHCQDYIGGIVECVVRTDH